MSFEQKETSRDGGRPVHLYRFRTGPNPADVFTYAALTEAVEHDDLTFAPLAITHTNVVSSGTLDKSTVTVTVPDDCPLAAIYSGEPPQGVVGVTIWEGHVGEPELRVAFAGRVQSARFTDVALDIEVEPIGASLRRSGLKRDWQLHCPLVLYGPRCRANRTAASRTVVLASVDGPFVTLPDAWAPAELKEKHQGGTLRWVNGAGRTVRRAIEEVDVNEIRLSSFIEDLGAGASVVVELGCDHTMVDCQAVHANIQNFGGQPAIPLKNPTGLVNLFY